LFCVLGVVLQTILDVYIYIYIYTQQYYSLLYLIVKYLFFTASVSILTCPEGDLT
jgi:hypothetical protein